MLFSLLLSACTLDIPQLGEPFVSEQLVGEWNGDWTVDVLFQEGDGSLKVDVADDGSLTWNLWMAGGPFTNDDHDYLEIELQGQDSTELLTLSGDVDILGQAVLNVTKDGMISGHAIPDDIPPVEIAGYVNSNEVYLACLLFEVIEGIAILYPEGSEAPEGQ